MQYHPNIGQPTTPTSAAVLEARRILAAVYSPQELAALPEQRLLSEAQAFEDARGAARTSGRWS